MQHSRQGRKEWLLWHTSRDLPCRAGGESVSREFEPIPVPLVLLGGNRDPMVVVVLEMLLGKQL